MLVTGQNLGDSRGNGTKLDFWVARDVEHGCAVRGSEASCTTRVTLENKAPKGLSPYVAGRPYGVLRNFVEVYIPGTSSVESVVRDGEATDFFEEGQDGRKSIGVMVRLERDGSSTIEVDYTLRSPGGYTFEAMPQPLAHDAHLQIALSVPEGWEIIGPEGRFDGDFRHSGPFAGPVRLAARPIDPPGLAGLWLRLVRFWHEPVF